MAFKKLYRQERNLSYRFYSAGIDTKMVAEFPINYIIFILKSKYLECGFLELLLRGEGEYAGEWGHVFLVKVRNKNTGFNWVNNPNFHYFRKMHWKIKAILQKILAANTLGDKLNHIPITLNKSYHYNTFLYQTHECLRKFGYCNIDLSTKRAALEVGTGYSILSAITQSLLGFEKVVTVDVTQDLNFHVFKKQAKYLSSPSFIETLLSKSIYTEKQLRDKIFQINKSATLDSLFKLLNIVYIAPYQFESIEKESSSFDYISSQVVLEHVPPKQLDTMFQNTKKWLTHDGCCVHTINFIDHFANPGFFQDKSISEFNFLKYSDEEWSYWAGNPIAYTNRLAPLYYMELCQKHNLKVIEFIGENYRKRVLFPEELVHKDVLSNYNTLTNIDKLTEFQRGTIIIQS